jgi:hypothetical protein
VIADAYQAYLPLGQALEVFVLFLAAGEILDELDHIKAQIPPGASQIGDQVPGDDLIPIVTPGLVQPFTLLILRCRCGPSIPASNADWYGVSWRG